MRRIHSLLRPAALPCLLLACLLLSSAESPAAAVARPLLPAQLIATAPSVGSDGKGDLAVASTREANPYGSTYTQEELAAIDQALDAINCTRADLLFEKDYGKGHACFPVVREMLRDPLLIAPFNDGLAEHCASLSAIGPRQIFELMQLCGESYYMPFMSYDDKQAFLSGESPDSRLREDLAMIRLVQLPRCETPEQLMDFLVTMASGIEYTYTPPLSEMPPTHKDKPPFVNFDQLRVKLPELLAWRDVFESPFSDPLFNAEYYGSEHVVDEAWKSSAEQISALEAFATLDVHQLFLDPHSKTTALWFSDPREWIHDIPDSAWPRDAPLIRDTPFGKICIGTPGNDSYAHERFKILIEPGGDDVYYDCQLGCGYGIQGDRTGYFVDMGGDDLYLCESTDFTLGAAILGFGAFYDLGQGNDRYYGGNVSLGAAMGGVALFYDDGGSDFYSGKVFTQGAAGFGIGIMIDDSVQPAPNVPTDEATPDPIDIGAFDNDHYTAWCMAQAFARTRGIALCINKRGNTVYHAGGVYLHAPLFSDRYQSFSQGFAIGERGIDYAGGIALLADYDGNDRYLGDIYNQGVGYWYSAGLLYDGGGNDTYEMTQYGQGSGIHLAVGGLVDVSGHDTYVMHSGLGQGSSHDYASSVLHDRGGNDKYYGTTSSCGTSLTNSAALFIDRSGDDTYAARLDGGFNTGRPARDAGGIGLFVDLAGNDDYLGEFSDGQSWVNAQYGSGVDVAPPLIEDGGKAAAATGSAQSPGGLAVPTDKTVIPQIVGYSGPLTQAVFDELWEIAIRWEVGDNQLIVPKARERLVEFGVEVLPFVEAKMDDPNSLAVRGYVGVLRPFAWQPVAQADTTQAAGDQSPAPPQPAETLPAVEALLARQLASGEEARQIAALSVIGELAITGAGDAVAALLDSPDMGLQRRALGVLGQLGSHSADERVIALLHPETDERLLKSAIVTACRLKLDCYPQLRALLDVPKFTARDALLGQLVTAHEAYADGMREDMLNASSLSTAAKRTLLRVYLRIAAGPNAVAPDSLLLGSLYGISADPDPGLQADREALLELWLGLVGQVNENDAPE